MTVCLNEQVADYIAFHQKLGYKFKENAQALQSFARFAQARNESFVHTQTALCWATASEGSSQQSQARKLRIVHNFACWVNAIDARYEIPPRNALGSSSYKRRPPHPVSIPNIRLLMTAALGKEPVNTIAPFTWHYLIGLVAATGLRISEALALKLDDITADGLIIRDSKFGKSRMIALHPSAREALNQYLQVRHKEKITSEYLFVIATGQPPSVSYAGYVFALLAEQVGLRKKGASSGPTFHSLRHAFAIRSLQNLPSGADVSRHMLALATYLGHARVSNTYWYLESTPVLLHSIAHATEQTHLRRCGGGHD